MRGGCRAPPSRSRPGAIMLPLGHEQFFHVANMVLKESGRSELPPVGPHRDIIGVRDDDRVLQILAGPGSGKTEMLVWRVLYDLCVRATPSDAVMVTTFTRRAATELNVRVVERCDQLLHFAKAAGYPAADPQVHNLRIGTIHSLCDGLLAEFDTDYMAAGTQLIDEPECVARPASPTWKCWSIPHERRHRSVLHRRPVGPPPLRPGLVLREVCGLSPLRAGPGDGGPPDPPRDGVAHQVPQGEGPPSQPGGTEGPARTLFPRPLGAGYPHRFHEQGEDD